MFHQLLHVHSYSGYHRTRDQEPDQEQDHKLGKIDQSNIFTIFYTACFLISHKKKTPKRYIFDYHTLRHGGRMYEWTGSGAVCISFSGAALYFFFFFFPCRHASRSADGRLHIYNIPVRCAIEITFQCRRRFGQQESVIYFTSNIVIALLFLYGGLGTVMLHTPLVSSLSSERIGLLSSRLPRY